MNALTRIGRATGGWLRTVAGVFAGWLAMLPPWAPADVAAGHLARFAQPRPLANLLARRDARSLAAMIRAGGASRAVALARLDRSAPVSPRELLDSVDEADLVHPVARLLVQHPDEAARSAVLYQAALAPAETGGLALSTVFSVTARMAETLMTTHARVVLEYALLLSQQPIDPYEPPGLLALAREAAAVIIAEHPELDSEMHDSLHGAPPAPVVQIVAAGLHLRRGPKSPAIVAALAAWSPNRPQARGFLQLIDARFEAGPVRPAPSRPSMTWQALLAVLGRGAAVVLPLIVSAVAGWMGAARVEQDPPIDPSLGAALTILGVLFAIDVYVSEQSAARLPGVLARHAGRARSLTAAYASAFALVVAATVRWADPTLAREAAWAGLVASGLFIAAAVFLLRAVVARLEPASAAAQFVRNRAWALMRSGAHLRRIRGRAMELKQLVAGLRPIRLVLSPVTSERREPISTGKRGFLLPNARTLRALSERQPYHDGHLTLNLSVSLGTIVRAHEEVASVTSDEDTHPPERELRAARRTVRRVRRVDPSDDVGDAVSGLVGLVGELIDADNHQAAQRVGQSLVRLVDMYLAGAHRRRQAPELGDDIGALPVLPALRDALSALTELAVHARGHALELVLGVIDDILQLAEPEDYGPAILYGRTVGSDAGPHVSSELLRLAGRRSLEIRDDMTLGLIRNELATRIAAGNREHLNTAAEITALAMWLDYFRSPLFWTWLENLLDLTNANHLSKAVQVGAAALEARVYSVALDVALAIADSHPQAIATAGQLAANPEFVSRARIWADQAGGYLGPSPGDAIDRFVRFSEGVHPAVQP